MAQDGRDRRPNSHYEVDESNFGMIKSIPLLLLRFNSESRVDLYTIWLIFVDVGFSVAWFEDYLAHKSRICGVRTPNREYLIHTGLTADLFSAAESEWGL